MIRPLRNTVLAAIALVATVMAGEILWRSWTAHSAEPAVTASIPHVAPAYAPQRVVYHVAENGGFLGRGFKKLLQVASNHVEALETGQLDLRIVLQGDGVDLLTDAKGDAALAARIDGLKAKECASSSAGIRSACARSRRRAFMGLRRAMSCGPVSRRSPLFSSRAMST